MRVCVCVCKVVFILFLYFFLILLAGCGNRFRVVSLPSASHSSLSTMLLRLCALRNSRNEQRRNLRMSMWCKDVVFSTKEVEAERNHKKTIREPWKMGKLNLLRFRRRFSYKRSMHDVLRTLPSANFLTDFQSWFNFFSLIRFVNGEKATRDLKGLEIGAREMWSDVIDLWRN